MGEGGGGELSTEPTRQPAAHRAARPARSLHDSRAARPARSLHDSHLTPRSSTHHHHRSPRRSPKRTCLLRLWRTGSSTLSQVSAVVGVVWAAARAGGCTGGGGLRTRLAEPRLPLKSAAPAPASIHERSAALSDHALRDKSSRLRQCPRNCPPHPSAIRERGRDHLGESWDHVSSLVKRKPVPCHEGAIWRTESVSSSINTY